MVVDLLQDDNTHAEAWREFLSAIRSIDNEPMPEFERVRFKKDEDCTDMPELWDILDRDRNPTGRLHTRGEPLAEGDYHLVVHAWIVNSRGEMLITRRDFGKSFFPGMWETPGGAALAGEGSLEAAMREAKEETGIILCAGNAALFSSSRGDERHGFYDNWLFRQEFDIKDVVLQEGETIEARTAMLYDIASMIERGECSDDTLFL